MDRAVETVLREYEARAEVESRRMRELRPDEFAEHLDEFLLSVGPATGQLLNILASEAEARVILEIGTSFGYSTVWLAEAASRTQGKVITLEIHPGKHTHARDAIHRAGLDKFVDFRLGDATETIAMLSEPIDFVLLDLWKNLYIPCFDLFYPKLRSGAIIVADNMIFPEHSRQEAQKYRAHVRRKPDIQSVLLPVGGGLEISRYTRDLDLT